MNAISSRVFAHVAPLFIALLAGCAATPPAAPPAPASKPAVVLPIAQLDRGVQIVLPDSVLFQVGKADLSPGESGAYLDRVAHLLKTKTAKRIAVEGHTDSTGAAALNQKLSEQRADSVADALVSRGVPADRITRKGLSFSQPAAPNDLDAGRRLNRRTELIVIDETVANITRDEPANTFEDAAARVKAALEAATQTGKGKG